MIVRGGFGVLRSHPIAVSIWALLHIFWVAAMNLVVRLPGFHPVPGADRNLSALPSAWGAGLLLNLVNAALFLVLFTAAMRSVLRPAAPGIAFLRLGADELREIGLGLFLLILGYVGAIILSLVAGLVLVLIMTVAGVLSPVVAVGAIALAVLPAFCWFAVRLSLAFPLTLLRGAITIAESWRLTRGRFWSLFGGFLLLYLIAMLLALGGAALTFGDYLADLLRAGYRMPALQLAMQNQLARQLGPIDAYMVLSWVAQGVAGAIGTALLGGGVAAAASHLVDVRQEMAETFA